MYGFDPDAPIPAEDDDGVIVPEADRGIAGQLQQFLEGVDLPTADEDKWGIETYKQIMRMINE